METVRRAPIDPKLVPDPWWWWEEEIQQARKWYHVGYGTEEPDGSGSGRLGSESQRTGKRFVMDGRRRWVYHGITRKGCYGKLY